MAEKYLLQNKIDEIVQEKLKSFSNENQLENTQKRNIVLSLDTTQHTLLNKHVKNSTCILNIVILDTMDYS